MNKKLHLKALVLLLTGLFFMQEMAHAQSSFMGQVLSTSRKIKDVGVDSRRGYWLSGWTVSQGMGFLGLDFQHTFSLINSHNELIGGEGNISRHYTPHTLYVETYSDLFLGEMGEKSILALHIGLAGVAYGFDPGPFYINEVSQYDYAIKGIYVGAPLGVDFIFGGEATHKKSDKTSLAFGMGFQPTLNGVGFGPDNSFKVDIRPYGRVSFGFFAGIEWKIFATFIPGESKVMSYGGNGKLSTVEVQAPNSRVSMKSGSIFGIGISAMPVSFLWSKDTW